VVDNIIETKVGEDEDIDRNGARIEVHLGYVGYSLDMDFSSQ
jgi:hypothetical protein